MCTLLSLVAAKNWWVHQLATVLPSSWVLISGMDSRQPRQWGPSQGHLLPAFLLRHSQASTETTETLVDGGKSTDARWTGGMAQTTLQPQRIPPFAPIHLEGPGDPRIQCNRKTILVSRDSSLVQETELLSFHSLRYPDASAYSMLAAVPTDLELWQTGVVNKTPRVPRLQLKQL